MEEDTKKYFPSLMRNDVIKTFKNITSLNRENLGATLNVFPRKNVKPQSIAAAKPKIQTQSSSQRTRS